MKAIAKSDRSIYLWKKIEIGFHLTNFRNLLQEVNFLNFLTHGKREGVNENIILWLKHMFTVYFIYDWQNDLRSSTLTIEIPCPCLGAFICPTSSHVPLLVLYFRISSVVFALSFFPPERKVFSHGSYLHYICKTFTCHENIIVKRNSSKMM